MSKPFATLQARAALAGIALLRSDPQDGPVRVLAQIAGAWRELRTPDDLESVIVHSAATAGGDR